MRFILLAVLAFSSNVFAADHIPYYGDAFYNEIATDRDADLVSDIQTVLTKKPQTPIGYTAARKALLGKLFLVQDAGNGYGIKEVYCGRTYTAADFPDGNKPGPDVLVSDKFLNVEHTWPQSRFTKKYPADMQKCDLHHLFPSDSKLNSIRGNFWFGEVDHQKQALKCNESKFGTWNGKGQFFEPPNAHKGNVARALFYFSMRYSSPIAADEEALLKKWSHDDPVDDDERARNDAIEKIQGNRNPFIDFPELADRISDF